MLELSLDATAASEFYSTHLCQQSSSKRLQTLDVLEPVTVTEQVVNVLSPPAATRCPEKLEFHAKRCTGNRSCRFQGAFWGDFQLYSFRLRRCHFFGSGPRVRRLPLSCI